MAAEQSQQFLLLRDEHYDDPSQLSQLLRQRAGAHNPLQSTASTEQQASTNPRAGVLTEATLLHDASRQPAAPALPVPNSTPRRVANQTRYVKPSLPKHHTAPTSTELVKNKGGGTRMYQSFAGVMDVPGDTQPDSQIYKDWTSGPSRADVDKHRNVGVSLLNPVEEQDADTTTDGLEQMGSSQEQHSPAVTNPTVVQDDDLESRLRFAPTSPLKFETPAMAGRKRDSQGQLLSSAMRSTTTPGTALTAAAFFGINATDGGGVQPMSLTQVFNATQAGTSPFTGAVNDDAVFQRPSPNFTAAGNSSPVLAISSPIKAARPDLPLRSSSEPRAEYVTMKQSQEQRARESRHKSIEPVEQDSFDEPTPSLKLKHARREARKRKERRENETAKSFAKVSAPSLSPSRPRKTGRTLLSVSKTSRQHTPAALRASRTNPYDGPHDSDQSESERSADELSRPVPANKVGFQQSSYGERSRDMSTSSQTPVVKATKPQEDKVQVPNTSSHPNRTLSGLSVLNSPPASPSLQAQRISLPQMSRTPSDDAGTRMKSSKESVTILDSQPDIASDVDCTSRPKSLLSSSPSANQYSVDQTTISRKTGYTSQVVSSSMPPIPPRSSQPNLDDSNEDEERVPSSPPAVNDDDIVYDEHCYDEHHSTGEEGEEVSGNDDVDVNLDDGLPGSQNAGAGKEEVELDEHPKTASDGVPETENAGHEIQSSELAEIHNDRIDGVKQSPMEPLEEEAQSSPHDEQDDLGRSSYLKRQDSAEKLKILPRVQRQSTVPESDILNDVQPSPFAQVGVTGNETDNAESAPEAVPPDQTNSTQPFHTAQEIQSTTSNNGSDQTPKISTLESPHKVSQLRTFDEVANLPLTQLSTDIGDIDMPKLSFTTEMDNELDGTIFNPSPSRPVSKKRKITYSAKKKAFTMPLNDSETLEEPTISSPSKQVQQTHEDTPSSTMEREEQGALAAANARQEALPTKPATLKLGRSSKPTNKRYDKKGGLKPINRKLLRISPAAEHMEDVDMTDPDVSGEGIDELANPMRGLVEIASGIKDADDRGEAPSDELLVQNRVFALWPGHGFYPATCLGRTNSNQLQVRFDDGTLHPLDPVHISALDLRIGDQVKVDEAGMKKHIFVVVGFKNQIGVNDLEYPLTDRHGYSEIVLEIKQRESLPKELLKQPQKPISVPMAKVYLTNQMWAKFRDRIYHLSPLSSPDASASRPATPRGAPESATTPIFPRRSSAGRSLLKEDRAARAGSEASTGRSAGGVIFANMAFAISFTAESSGRDAVTKLITSNGGVILDDGFHELFRTPKDPSFIAAASNKSIGRGKGKGKTNVNVEENAKTTIDNEVLDLKEEYRSLRFVALISDSHSRRLKYLQALALNIPCIHHRWLMDSITATAPLGFGKYLLPAGISIYLDSKGATRSRTMELYKPDDENSSFYEIFKQRNTLFKRMRVLLVTGTSKKDKDKERHDLYHFIMHALGSTAVRRCADIAVARDILQDEAWEMVFLDKNVGSVAQAAKTLVGVETSPGPELASKTKNEVVSLNVNMNGNVVKVVGDEYLVQSLVLDTLFDE